MRSVRVLLLVLLAALLPLRGVMAAAMLCPPPAEAAGDAHVGRTADDGAPVHAGGDAHHHAAAEAGSPGHHHEGTSGTDTCNLCSACCSVPPVPSAAPAVPLPHGLASADFPACLVPPPSFLSDGQDRPPRST